MAINPNYESISKTFVQQYYAMFDGDLAMRANIVNFYSETKSLMSFEGDQIMGRQKIMQKLQGLTFKTIQHMISTVEAQPTFDGGVLVLVLGQLKTDDDPPHNFSQVFVLKPAENTFYIEHDIFRLALV